MRYIYAIRVDDGPEEHGTRAQLRDILNRTGNATVKLPATGRVLYVAFPNGHMMTIQKIVG